MANTRSLLDAAFQDLRCSWKALALADVVYKTIAFIVLTPLVELFFSVVLSVSGNEVLADQDILFFFLGPAGWLCLVTVGALWLGIVALEQSALMGIICAARGRQRIGILGALKFATTNAWPVLRVAARLITFTLLAIAPFLAAAGLVYFALLTEYDINYYLKEKPPEFLTALGIGGVIVATLLALLLRLFTGWCFALPLVLFENISPVDALRVSRERAHGQRTSLLLWIVGWFVATLVLSLLASAAVVALGRLLVPSATGSLKLLVLAIGATLFFWAVVNLAVNLVSSTTFAAILFNLYRQQGSEGNIDSSRLSMAEGIGNAAGFRLTRTRLFSAGVVGVVVVIGAGGYVIQRVRLEDHVAVTAHRGSSKAAPENTMAAIKKAIEDGADWVEIDIQETAAGEVVVFHDSDFMKLAGVNLKIWDATMADLKEIDIGSWFAPRFADQRVPTLADVLNECKGKVGVNIELKYYGHDQQLEQRAVAIVESHGMASEVVFMSLKIDAVKKMKAMRPRWTVGLLMSVAAGNLKKVDADFLAVNANFADRSFIHAAHARGRQVHVWTVNDAPTMSTMIGRGADNLITDKPALARSVIAQRAQMTPVERLLLELAGMLGVAPEIGEP